MKKFFIALTTLCITIAGMNAQDLEDIKLNAPDKTRGTAVMKALSDRKSVREFDTKDLSLQDLSDLLWAANGINRPDGKRTAPTAKNCQEIDVYVINKNGAYLYDPSANILTVVAKGDFRKSIASQQDYVLQAPVCIVLVANLEKLGDPSQENTRLMAAVDAGIVCQNINIFCSAVGLSTVPRAWMVKDELKKALNLSDTQFLMMNNPVGYPKK